LYYTNIKSVKADMKLLRDNCMKYNTIDSDVSIEADNLFKAFVDLFEEKLQDLYTMTGTKDSSDLTVMEAKSKASDGVTLRYVPQERDEQSSRQTFAQVSSENEALQTNQISIDENSEGEDDRKVKLRVVIGNKHITSSDEDDSVLINSCKVCNIQIILFLSVIKINQVVIL
jgi:hypothetical protein